MGENVTREMSVPAFTYCARRVKAHDPDRYLTALFAPRKRRAHLTALYAFNLEIAQIREHVSEPLLGEIRLQWWRETIDGLYQGAVRQHDVARALAVVIEDVDLPRRLFDELLEARAADLDNVPFADESALLGYVRATSAHVMTLAGLCLAPDMAPPDLEAVTGPAGAAWAITGLIRALPWFAARGRCPLPRAVLARHGVAAENVVAGRPGPGLEGVIGDLSALALHQLEEAQARLVRLPDAALPAVLPAALCRQYLGPMTAPGFDPLRQTLEHPLFYRQLRLLWAMARRRL